MKLFLSGLVQGNPNFLLVDIGMNSDAVDFHIEGRLSSPLIIRDTELC